MTTGAEANSGTTAVRDGFDIDRVALADWMLRNVADYSGPLDVAQFRGGQSNPTYLLTASDRRYVMRKKPSGQLLRGAHAIEREARVLASLSKAGFPVAALHGLCVDDTVIGTPFYVMDMVDGRIFWEADVPGVGTAERHAIFDAMNGVLAQLHGVDYRAVGLEDYGPQGNYVGRQIRRWSTQYIEDVQAGRDPNMDRLLDWLPANMPDDDVTSLIHGDFRIDNLIFHPVEPRVVAVLDWELSTLGHPLADFAYNAMMYRMPPHIVAGLAGADIDRLGIPTETDYLRAYCARTGRTAVPGYDFYIAFNFFRLAAIFHGIKGRVIRGTAASADARQRAQVFPELAALAWAQAQRAAGARP